MIRIIAGLVKLNKMCNTSIQEMTDIILSSFRGTRKDRCPFCGACSPETYCTYERSVTDWHNGKLMDCMVRTLCLRCSGCGHYHVVLPGLIVPYRMHSLRLILHALADYHSGRMTVEEICGKYSITPPTLYRWRDQFAEDKELWLKALADAETAASEFIRWLFEEAVFRTFSEEFAEGNTARRSFMQAHRMAFSHRYV